MSRSMGGIGGGICLACGDEFGDLSCGFGLSCQLRRRMLWETAGLTVEGGLGQSEVPVEGTEQPPHDHYVYALSDEAAYLQADDDKKPQIVEPVAPAPTVCQFCGKSYGQVPTLFEAKRKVRDPNTDAIVAVWICNQCVARMAQTLAEQPPGTHAHWVWQVWSRRGPMRP